MLNSWKAKIHFWFEDVITPAGRAVDIAVVSLVFLVSVIFVMKTYPISDELRGVLDMAENIIVGIFVLEYCLRMWSAPSKLRQFFNIYAIVDLIAIIPLFFGEESFQFLRVVRALRFLRLIRFLRREHFFFTGLTFAHIIAIRIAYIIFSIIFISAGLIFYAEHDLPGSSILTFYDAVYFAIVTLTTVGYGDITPVSEYGRFVTILIIASGIIFIPWQIRDFILQLFVSSGRKEVLCRPCGLRVHDEDARYCKACGAALGK